jgi:hypothetical protein
MPREHKMLLTRDLPVKGITWSRQHINRKIRAGEFPPPDGKTSNAPSAPNWWWDETINKYLQRRAAAMRETRRLTSTASSSE